MSQLTVRKQSGQALVIIALVITGMLLLLGVLIDGGLDYYARRQGQNAADSAALASVRVLASKAVTPTTFTDINTAVISYSQANILPFTNAWGGSGSQTTAYFVMPDDVALVNHTHCGTLVTDAQRGVKFNGTVPANARGVRVYISATFQAFIMGLWNSNGQVASAACATAIFGAGGGNAVPILVPRCYADPNDPYNDRCKKNPGDDPTKIEHIILGKVQGSELFNGNQLGAIVDFNSRVGANPQLVPPAASAWSASDFNSFYVWGANSCDYLPIQPHKGAAVSYIDAGGYGGQCSPLQFGSVAPTLSSVGDWAGLLYGVAAGNGGPLTYQKSPHPYNPGDSILVVLFQECKTITPSIFPPLCEAVDGGSGQTDAHCNGNNCRAKLVGRAWMKITKMTSNELTAIFDPSPHLTETCVDPTKCGGPDLTNSATTIQLVP
ncbi:MAG TPA: TadE/TadG family type IV pilus assembly protein [Anaerolineae bacterium]